MKKLTTTLGIVLMQMSLFAQIPTDNLQLHLPFNSNALDESGNGNDGIVNGATLTNDRFGVPNAAYFFDGGDWIEVMHDASIDFNATDDYTVSVWVKMEVSHFAGTVIGKWNNNPAGPYPYRLFYGNPGNPGEISSIRYLGGAPPQDSLLVNKATYTGLLDTLFHLVTAVYTNDKIELYYDVTLVDSAPNYMTGNNTSNADTLFNWKKS